MGAGVLETRITFHNAMQDDERLMAWPLVSVAQMALGFIYDRVPRGQGPQGPFRKYSESKKEGGFTLIPAGLPHPSSGLMFKTKDGRAAYPSYGAWKRSSQGVASVNLRRSGNLLRSLQIKVMSPTKVRVNQRGKNLKGKSNSAVARFVQATTRQQILGLTGGEMQQIARHIEAAFPPRYLDATKLNEMSFKARQKLTAAQRSLAKTKQLYLQARQRAV